MADTNWAPYHTILYFWHLWFLILGFNFIVSLATACLKLINRVFRDSGFPHLLWGWLAKLNAPCACTLAKTCKVLYIRLNEPLLATAHSFCRLNHLSEPKVLSASRAFHDLSSCPLIKSVYPLLYLR